MEKAKKPLKKRNWAFIVYPESAPGNWIDILSKKGIPFAISPLHDKDVNPDGEVKKAHYHVIVCFGGPTSYSVVSNLTSSINASNPQALEAVIGYYRYLTHKDNPEKAQYSDKDIHCGNGFSILDYSDLKTGEKEKIKKKLQYLIRELALSEYCDFMDILLESGTDEEYSVASNNTYFFDKYLTSIRNKRDKNIK